MVIRCRQVNQAGAPQRTVTMRRVNTTMGWVKVLRECCQLLQSFFSPPQGPVAQHSFNLYTHWPEIYLDHQFYRNLVHNTVLDLLKPFQPELFVCACVSRGKGVGAIFKNC